MEKISIVSLNAHGLGDSSKRRDVFHYLQNKNYSIVCLQDTHFTKNIENIICAEWGYKVCFSSFRSNARGVAILFKNKFEFKIYNQFSDTNGNILLLDIEIDQVRMSLISIYGPNEDNPLFYERLKNRIIQFGNEHILITGDWNLLLDPSLDGKNYKHINNPKARQQVLKMMTELKLYDVWREENGEEKVFTWRKKINKGQIQMGRLDFFLISESLLSFVREEKISHGYRSDHSAVSLSLIFNKSPRGRTFWKFNNSFLKNLEFIDEIKKTLRKIKIQYCATPYNIENIDSIDNENLHLTINPQLFFEMFLLEVRTMTVSFASKNKKQENEYFTNLEKEIELLEQENKIENFDIIKEKELELKNLREKKLIGSLIRSRARWVEQGEKPTNYFCHLENRNFVSKRMNFILKNNEEEIYDPNLIKKEVFNFYNKLYSSNEINIKDVDLNKKLKPENNKLSEDQAFSLEGLITVKEAANFLFKMNNNKSPGSSGFTTEFYKFFWKDIGTFLVKSINYGFKIKEMSSSQKEGVITCIPKGDKPRKFLKNWRPISLLNISYKIATGCIASRIKSVLPFIINEDQSGFMSDRSTSDNIRLIYDVLEQARLQNKPGLLLLIDFEKAFDTVAWSFIFKSLKYFNFKSDIINWIKTFYKDIKSTIIVNNSPTAWFNVGRGCRQGDPISPYIFLLCSEILALLIRQNENIKGYMLFGLELKINQFADDTSLFLDGSQKSFEYCVETVLEYAKYSGLSMNFDKTKVVWFGCEEPPNRIYLPHLNFNWNPSTFNILGIDFTTNLHNITDKNIEKKAN